jgi:hypothetical protein
MADAIHVDAPDWFDDPSLMPVVQIIRELSLLDD